MCWCPSLCHPGLQKSNHSVLLQQGVQELLLLVEAMVGHIHVQSWVSCLNAYF